MKGRAILIAVLLRLVLGTGVIEAAERGEFVRLVIPKIGMTASIVVLEATPNGWEELPSDLVGQLDGSPRVFYVHRNSIGHLLDELEAGDSIKLYRDWDMAIMPLRLRVVSKRRVLTTYFDVATSRADDDTFFIVTCHPPGGPPWPQRLVIEARVTFRSIPKRTFAKWR